MKEKERTGILQN